MQIKAMTNNNIVYMTLQGEIDEHSAERARREADRLIDEYAAAESAVIDLSGVPFMDSTGIGFLIGRYKKCKRYSIPAYVCRPNPSADKILSMSGVYTLIPKLN